MLLNIRWGSLRAKIIAWFFVPSAVILFTMALIAYLTTPGSSYRSWLALLLLSGLIVPAIVVYLGLTKIAKPIAELTHAAQEVARGNFGLMVTAETGDEIEELAEQFNAMSRQLQEAYSNLEKRITDRTRELATLNAVAEVVSHSLELDEILNGALRESREWLGAHAGTILLADASRETLTVRVDQGFTDTGGQPVRVIGLREGISGLALAQGEPVVMDIQDYPAHASNNLVEVMNREGAQTLVSVPILTKRQALGTMTLVSKEKRDFPPQQMGLLMSISRQIGVAIENSRLYEQARQEIARREQVEAELRHANEESERRNRELTLLNRVISATTSNMEPEAILEVVCHELVKAFGVTQSAAALLDKDGATLTVVAECKSETGSSAMGVVIPVEDNPATLYVLKNKAPLAIADAQHDYLLNAVHELMRQRGVVSILLLPIIVDDQVIGTLGMDSAEPREFQNAEITLATRVTAAVAQALERAGAGNQA